MDLWDPLGVSKLSNRFKQSGNDTSLPQVYLLLNSSCYVYMLLCVAIYHPSSPSDVHAQLIHNILTDMSLGVSLWTISNSSKQKIDRIYLIYIYTIVWVFHDIPMKHIETLGFS